MRQETITDGCLVIMWKWESVPFQIFWKGATCWLSSAGSQHQHVPNMTYEVIKQTCNYWSTKLSLALSWQNVYSGDSHCSRNYHRGGFTVLRWVSIFLSVVLSLRCISIVRENVIELYRLVVKSKRRVRLKMSVVWVRWQEVGWKDVGKIECSFILFLSQNEWGYRKCRE